MHKLRKLRKMKYPEKIKKIKKQIEDFQGDSFRIPLSYTEDKSRDLTF